MTFTLTQLWSGAIQKIRFTVSGLVALFPVTAVSANWDMGCTANYAEHVHRFNLKLEQGEIVGFEYISFDSTGHDCELTAYKYRERHHGKWKSNWSVIGAKLRVDNLRQGLDGHFVPAGSVELTQRPSSYTFHVVDLANSCAPSGNPWIAPTVVLYIGQKSCQLIDDDGKVLTESKHQQS